MGSGTVELSAKEQERLARFAAAFERLGASDYALFASPGTDEHTRRATDAAETAIGSGPRRQAVRSAVGEFTDWAARGYAHGQGLPGTSHLQQSFPDRADDRVRFLASLEHAILAVILWEELREEELGALLGPWAEIVDQAGIQ